MLPSIIDIQYIYGIIGSLVLTGLIWVYMFIHFLKGNNVYSFGGLLIAIGFFSMAYRNYLFFIIENKTASENIMISAFISTATFLAGSIIICLPYFNKS